jgi:hypothetical protein
MRQIATLFLIYTLAFPFELAAQFTSLTNLNPLEASTFATREKQQAKIFSHAGKHWAILANSTGTHLWQLEGTTWKHALNLVTKNSLADYVIHGNVVHILLYSGPSSQFLSIEYDNSMKRFKPWSGNRSTVTVNLEQGIEVASIDMDKRGRLWIASTGDNGDINVRWSDAPYTGWSAPITIAQGVHADDICAVISLPKTNQIGVMWSNQNTKRWGFKTHTIGDETTQWSKDEVPASQSALSRGSGMADDHINMKVAADGTLYAAIKTGYDKIGYPLIALLVRRPSGVWDELYEVSQTGTLPIVVLSEEQNLVKVIYTSATYGGDILYKESSTSNIVFCDTHTLISGNYNYASSTKGNYKGETVILASSQTHVVGVVAVDEANSRSPLPTECVDDDNEALFVAYPNPFLLETTVNFKFSKDEKYSLTLYDSNGARIGQVKESSAEAGKLNTFILEASTLARGLYLLKLETGKRVKTLKLIHER